MATLGGVEMGVTLWQFAEAPDGSMRRIAAARVERFRQGKERLPPSAPGELRIVQVALMMDHRQVESFLLADHVRFLLSDDGTLDPDHRDHAISGLGGWIDMLEPEPVGNVVDLTPMIAEREYRARHEWSPRPDQLHEVAAVINAAAAHPPVVVVTSEGLRRV